MFVEELFEHQTLSSRMVFDQQNGVVRTPKKWYIHLKRIEFGVEYFFYFFILNLTSNPLKIQINHYNLFLFHNWFLFFFITILKFK